MSPTSYQAAPPRALDTTRLAALLQLDESRRIAPIAPAVGGMFSLDFPVDRTFPQPRRRAISGYISNGSTIPSTVTFSNGLTGSTRFRCFRCLFSAQNSGTLTLELLHVLSQNIGVDIQSSRDAAVPQEFRHDRHRHASVKLPRRERVPAIPHAE
jgi:hypothetical protein